MSERRTRPINVHGLGLAGLPGEPVKDFRVYAENGAVQIWAAVGDFEVMQYLTPNQADEFAAAFSRSAFEARWQAKKARDERA